ncbi:hypothetical protein BACT_1099 [Bifidobacterium actinocoloniiforme DSM 22766]|uniref:Uncharacterized protein n=1 Tax=Bifidobacterium actinocoloniiforme DSM 22766 TaxID=1437605 RepID=A0A086Z1J7_9BIFI|nr:hypothetical protein [Bifidobacterium actinocoloniiforme]AKV55531.1 hypothetical protein AB656_04105 [Bifidobacterium actinocoloniiforme DSM 22766]KFI40397.1 hypothetical protein BACT_1099 [Bifidobacterium actinocoloniiforme DSM 22766]
MQKSIQDQIADGDLTPYEAAEQITLATAMQRVLTERVDALKGYMADVMDPREHYTTHTGVVTAKRGAEPKWRVKDPRAYAEWLDEHGETSGVEETLMPVDVVTKHDAIEHLIRQFGGETPDGVELSRGTADTVAVSKVKSWDDIYADQELVGQARQVLGLEAGDSEDEDDEEDAWDAI